ncbi:hypothetical protein [Brassicibacter mesophilus]|uniref:hypothetical protein n=1 Tax=Brassicibacter mesophilus TaxID=745119 RepID=UPI003D2071F9
MKLKVSLLVVVVMIIGIARGIGTYAWFTSSATSNNNDFIAGILEINGDNTTEPSPLFKTDYGDGYYSNYNVGLWYPGKEVLGDSARNYTIENAGTLDVKIAGLSAEITVFTKNSTNYLVEDIDSWPTDVKESYDEFVENLNIVVNNIGQEYFNGSLESLIDGPQPLKRRSDNYIITLNTTNMKRANLSFGAFMHTAADNKAQGVNATINIIVHATQDNDSAVSTLLNN